MTADIYGQTALHLAARNSDGDVVKLLVGVGSNIEARDRTGRTPIYHAITTGNMEAITELVQAGASLNVADDRGETPLSLTDTLNRVDVCEFLRKSGASAESIVPEWPENSSPMLSGLFRATGENRMEAVKYLLGQGANPDTADASGETALFYAVRASSPNMVQLLLSRGAKTAWKNNSGQRPLDLAIELSRKAGRRSDANDDIRAQVTTVEQQYNWVRIIELLTPKSSSDEKPDQKN